MTTNSVGLETLTTYVPPAPYTERLIHKIIAQLAEGTWTWTLHACKNQHNETVFVIRRDGTVYDALSHDRSDAHAYRMAKGNMKRYALEARAQDERCSCGACECAYNYLPGEGT